MVCRVMPGRRRAGRFSGGCRGFYRRCVVVLSREGSAGRLRPTPAAAAAAAAGVCVDERECRE